MLGKIKEKKTIPNEIIKKKIELETSNFASLPTEKIKPKLKPKPVESEKPKTDLQLENKPKPNIKKIEDKKILDKPKPIEKPEPALSKDEKTEGITSKTDKQQYNYQLQLDSEKYEIYVITFHCVWEK